MLKRGSILFVTTLLLLVMALAFTHSAQAASVPVNPWHYSFDATGGTTITAPDQTFCTFFKCIANFWHGSGFVIACKDGMFSKSGGHTGSCSKHGGDAQTLYAHASSSNPVQPVKTPPALPLTGSAPY